MIGFGLVMACFVVGGLWMLQDRLIYFPGPDPGPALAPWEELTVESDGGLALCLLSRRGANHGLGPAGDPGHGPHGAGVR